MKHYKGHLQTIWEKYKNLQTQWRLILNFWRFINIGVKALGSTTWDIYNPFKKIIKLWPKSVSTLFHSMPIFICYILLEVQAFERCDHG